MGKRFIRIIFCHTLAFLPILLSAQSVQDSTEVRYLEQASVSAERLDKEIVPVQRLSGKKLKNLNTLSVADAIRYFSGIQIKDYGGVGGLKTVNVRSLGSHHTGVFYDGIELGNAQNGVIDLGRFSMDNMESVALYNGQRSALLQSAKDYASSNAIYMTTRTPYFHDGKNFNIRVGLRAGSFATVNPSIIYEQKLSNHVSLSANADFLYTSGRYRFTYSKKDGYDTTAVRTNSDVRMLRVEAGLFGKIKRGSWKAKIYYYNSERGYPGAVIREKPGVFFNEDRQWDDNVFVQGSYRQEVTKYWSILINGKYSYDKLHYVSDPRLDVTTMFVDNTYRQHEGFISASHLFKPFRWWSLSLATDFQWNRLDADLREFVYPTRFSFYAAAATSFELGRVNISASALYLYIKDFLRQNASELNIAPRERLSPSLIFSYRPIEDVDLAIKAFYKNSFRMPTFNDLYYTFIGTKDLKPESTDQIDIGVSYVYRGSGNILENIGFSIDGYYNSVTNKIIAMPTSNQFRWSMMNLGKVRITGTDITLHSDIGFYGVHLFPRISYTWQLAQDVTDPASQWYKGQIAYIPQHSGTFILQGEYGSWGLNYSFVYTGERYESSANIPENYVQPWYTHDISLTKIFTFKNSSSLKISLEVNNIFNQQYEVVQCYPMPGTNFMIKLNYNL